MTRKTNITAGITKGLHSTGKKKNNQTGISIWVPTIVGTAGNMILGIALVIVSIFASPYLLDRIALFNKPVYYVYIPISHLEDELSKANIILSNRTVPQVRIWLQSDPDYKVLSENCLNLLAGKKLVNPVPIDFINAKYRELRGYEANTHLPVEEYNEIDTLKKAIFSAWKDMYSESNKTYFDQIIEYR